MCLCRLLSVYRHMTDVARHVQLTLRGLRKAPGFVATVVLTIALAVGVTACAFTIVDRLLLRSLPFPNADPLFSLSQRGRALSYPPSHHSSRDHHTTPIPYAP